jgi:hypothetical protein
VRSELKKVKSGEERDEKLEEGIKRGGEWRKG